MPLRIPAYGAGGYLGPTTPHGITNPFDPDEYGALIPDWAREADAARAAQQPRRGGGGSGRSARPHPLATALGLGGPTAAEPIAPSDVTPASPGAIQALEKLPEPPEQGRPQADYNALAQMLGVTPAAIQAMDTARSQAAAAVLDPASVAYRTRALTRSEAGDLERQKQLGHLLGVSQGQLMPEFEQAGQVVNRLAGGHAYETGYGARGGALGAELSEEGTAALDAALARQKELAETGRVAQQTFQAEQNRLNREAAMARVMQASENAVVPSMDPDTGLTTWIRRSEAPGQRAGGTATEREAIIGGQNTLTDLDMLIKKGDEIGWKGIGPAGGLKSFGYKFLGIGSQEEEEFRDMLQKFQADLMFGAGGKQLTITEMKAATRFLADIYTHPTAAKTRLNQIRPLLQRHQAARTGAVPPPVNPETDWEDVKQ